MANLIYGQNNVDDKYSPLTEPNLWGGAPFQPGISFTNKYETGPMGQLFIHKQGISNVVVGAPGADFVNTDTADTLIAIPIDTAFQASEKIRNVSANAVAYDLGASKMETVMRSIREQWHLTAMENLLAGETSVTAPVNTTATAADGSDIYNDVVANRQKLVEQKAQPNTLVVSPETYSKLLKAPEFQRSVDLANETVYEGMVGRIAGLNVFEYNIFDQGYSNGDTIAGITLDANDKVEYIMYDYDAFSIITTLDMMRLKDSETFNGSLAQAELVSGFKVTNDDRVLAKVAVIA